MSSSRWRSSSRFADVTYLGLGVDVLLIALTMALLAALVFAATVWHLLRLERQRSDARIAALTAAIDDRPGPLDVFNSCENDARVETSLVSLFAPEMKPATDRTLFAVGALVALAATILLLLVVGRGERFGSPESERSPRASSLELLAMHHAVNGDTLIVSGLVRNQAESSTPALTAVVSAVGRDGQVVARGQARLDPAFLESGKETSFRVIVTAAHASDLGRYRLSFLAGDHVVPHVDRRNELGRTAMATD